MCGRYTITESPRQIAERFLTAVPDFTFAPRYNAAPTQFLPVIVQNENGERRIALMQWGLIPSWATDPAIGSRLINARAETVTEKPSFRSAVKSRRCIVPADSFYEWKKRPAGGKTPLRISPEPPRIAAFAGLWERWKNPAGEEVLSFTIITTTASEQVASIHDRMPLILAPEEETTWLNPKTPMDAIKQILQRPVMERISAHEVSKRVNSAKNNDAQLIEPSTSPPETLFDN